MNGAGYLPSGKPSWWYGGVRHHRESGVSLFGFTQLKFQIKHRLGYDTLCVCVYVCVRVCVRGALGGSTLVRVNIPHGIEGVTGLIPPTDTILFCCFSDPLGSMHIGSARTHTHTHTLA